MSYSDGVTKINDSLDRLTGLVSSKREFIIKQTANSVLLFIILIVFGCLDFATLEFHAEYLISASYWGTIATKMVAAICALNVGINMMLENEIKKSEELKRSIEQYDKLIKLKDTDFEYFVNRIFNRNLKIQAYKANINRKIHRLNRFSTRRSRLLYSSELPENQKKKAKNIYCIKRKELEELKEDSFIEKNIESLYVRYHEVDPSVFELEINGAAKSRGIRVTGNIIVGRIKESSTIIMSMLAISMLTTSFVLGASKEVFENQMVAFWHYCLKAVEDVGVVLWQFFNGTLRARKIVSTQLTQPYAGRVVVLLEYVNWRKKNQIEETPAFKELNKEAEEVIEITEEQLQELQGTKKDPEE